MNIWMKAAVAAFCLTGAACGGGSGGNSLGSCTATGGGGAKVCVD